MEKMQSSFDSHQVMRELGSLQATQERILQALEIYSREAKENGEKVSKILALHSEDISSLKEDRRFVKRSTVIIASIITLGLPFILNILEKVFN